MVWTSQDSEVLRFLDLGAGAAEAGGPRVRYGGWEVTLGRTLQTSLSPLSGAAFHPTPAASHLCSVPDL